MKCIGVVNGVKIIQTKLCPKDYWMSFFGLILTYHDEIPSKYTVNHEKIHFAQAKELGWVPFYLIYCLEYALVRIWQYKFDHDKAYRNISFEKEAYGNASNLDYLSTRKHYAEWRK